MRGYTGKNGLSSFEISEHRKTENVIAIARLATGNRAGLCARSHEVDEARWLWNRQRPEEQLGEQRKDGRGCADAKRERQGRDNGDERRLDQRADGESYVSHEL